MMDGEETWAAGNNGGINNNGNGKGFASGSTNALHHAVNGGTRYQAVVADDGGSFTAKVRAIAAAQLGHQQVELCSLGSYHRPSLFCSFGQLLRSCVFA